MSIISQLKKRKVIFGFKHEELDVKMGYSARCIQQETENAGSKLVRGIRSKHTHMERKLINVSG